MPPADDNAVNVDPMSSTTNHNGSVLYDVAHSKAIDAVASAVLIINTAALSQLCQIACLVGLCSYNNIVVYILI